MFGFHSDPSQPHPGHASHLDTRQPEDRWSGTGRTYDRTSLPRLVDPPHALELPLENRAGPPQFLVDEMVKGPFTIFIHEHRFEAQGADRCVMHDTITYQWGRSWWGRLVSATAVKIYLVLLFKYRHHRTRKWALAA